MKQESILMYGTATVSAFPQTEQIRNREDDGFDEDNDDDDFDDFDEDPDLDDPGPEEDLERDPNPEKDKEQQEYNTPHPDISRDQPKAK